MVLLGKIGIVKTARYPDNLAAIIHYPVKIRVVFPDPGDSYTYLEKLERIRVLVEQPDSKYQ